MTAILMDADVLVWLIMVMVMSLLFTILSPQMMNLQATMYARSIKKYVAELDSFAQHSRKVVLKLISKYGRKGKKLRKEIDAMLDFFTIAPVDEDPVGIIKRLEHILNIRENRLEGAAKILAPRAPPEIAANIEAAMEAAIYNYLIFKIARHLAILAEKTKNAQLTMLVQMNMPFLHETAKSLSVATEAIAAGKPIGDGIGPLVVLHLAGNRKWTEPIKDTLLTEVNINKRKVILIKAKGPGARVGKPGELVSRILKKRKIARVITIDACGKLEGEESGQVAEGVGVAIGGPPTEKFKIEEVATMRGVPVDAIAIKESFSEAVSPLHSMIAKSAKLAKEMVLNAIINRTKPGDTVIVAGIGNTVGIGQSLKDLPKRFPPPPSKKGIESPVLEIS